MIRSYKYLDDAVQLQLHQFVIAFFDRIEFETADFDEAFFGEDFLEIANRHPQILKQRCIDIFEITKEWDQQKRTELCNQIRDSNKIENICEGNYTPQLITRTASGVRKLLRDLFIDLYNQVLDGDGFNEKYTTTLRSHFDAFSKLNKNITLCPICGIGELKKHTDLARDQYDHYLPKSIYPLSAVNFTNLVPVCIDCNSPQVKGSKDVISLATNQKLFYLYDTNYDGLKVIFKVANDALDPNEIEWQIDFICAQGKQDEIETWKTIYNIDGRYTGFVNARIEKWFRHYWEFINDADLSHLSNADRHLTCFKSYEKDETLQLNFIRKPALEGFLIGSILSQATIEAKHYSTPDAESN